MSLLTGNVVQPPLPGKDQLVCQTHGVQWSVDGETGAIRVPGICKLCRDELRGGAVTACPEHGNQPVDARFPNECVVCALIRRKGGGAGDLTDKPGGPGPRPPDVRVAAKPPRATARRAKKRTRRGGKRGKAAPPGRAVIPPPPPPNRHDIPLRPTAPPLTDDDLNPEVP